MSKLMSVRTAVAVILAGCCISAHAATDAARAVNIPAGDLRQALLQASEQFGTDLVYRPEQVGDVRTTGAVGRFTTQEAIFRLLQGTSFELRADPSGAMLIAQSTTTPGTQTQEATGKTIRVAQVTGPSNAADSTSEQSEPLVEEVVVTGSNLRRTGAEDVLPVTTLSQDQMQLRNALTPVEMLSSLPQVTGSPANESPRGGAGARGDIATVTMRGLSASDTLVLLNGRRIIAHPTTDALQYAPNVNQLPTQGLARIEILRDGASSIYGSDAVAGVVNYITARDFQGSQISVRLGTTEQGGGETQQVALTHGGDFASNRGRFVTTLEAFNREAIWLRDRDFSTTTNNTSRVPAPFNAIGGPFDGRSGTGIYPVFRVGSGTSANYFRPVNGAMTLTTVAPTRANNPEFYGNNNAYTMGLGESQRVNLFTALEFDLTDDITLFSDVSYYHADSKIIRNPINLNAPSADQLAPMSIDNPYNPYGSRFYDPAGLPNADGMARLVGTPRSITLQSVIFDPNQRELTDVSSQTYRVVGGVRGTLADRWNWEVGALHSYGSVTDSNPYSVRESLFQAALMQTTPSTAYNPFGYTFKVQDGAVVADQPYTNNDAVLDSFTQEWRREGRSELTSFDARIGGSLLSIWSGDITAGVGMEYREEAYRDFRPPYAGMNPPDSGLNPNDNDFIPASPKPDARGDRSIKSFYAETIVPLVSSANDVPLVDTLELSASVRHERYDDFGSTTKPKFGLNFRPVKSVMLRASYNEGFTAPSLPLLYNASQWAYAGAPGSIDPYRQTATAEGAYIYRSGTAGNPDLDPVDSEGVSAGIVFEVPFVRGLSISADYWQIEQSNIIASLGAAQIRNNDMLLLTAYTQAQIAAGVPIDAIDFGEGTAGYKGDAAVTRVAPTLEDRGLFAAYNAANPGAPLGATGRIFQIDAPPLNLSTGKVAGWDFNVSYNMPTAIGDIAISADATHVLRSYTILNAPGTAPIYTERLDVDGNAEWRGSMTTTWRNGGWAAGVSAYYIGSYADSNATTTGTIYESLGRPNYIVPQYTGNANVYRYKIDDVLYFNAFGSYAFDSDNTWLSGSNIKLGIINLSDEAPPVAAANFGYGYSVAVHSGLLQGRAFTLEMSKKF
ncbi:TonB-dependent receptor [Povalibacter sp.]|uniref:TonB-dependent receptor n=1 Tax=Povalibacter sp. TaxID=1962978 RepID=UPI002F40203B